MATRHDNLSPIFLHKGDPAKPIKYVFETFPLNYPVLNPQVFRINWGFWKTADLPLP